MRLKPERVADYEEAHKLVWPELLSVLKIAKVSDYSIFREGTDLFFYLCAPDFDAAFSQVKESQIDARWQAAMRPFLEDEQEGRGNGGFRMMTEVFHLD